MFKLFQRITKKKIDRITPKRSAYQKMPYLEELKALLEKKTQEKTS